MSRYDGRSLDVLRYGITCFARSEAGMPGARWISRRRFHGGTDPRAKKRHLLIRNVRVSDAKPCRPNWAPWKKPYSSTARVSGIHCKQAEQLLEVSKCRRNNQFDLSSLTAFARDIKLPAKSSRP